MKSGKLVLSLMILTAIIQLMVLGGMVWSHHQVMEKGKLIRLDLGVVYVNNLNNQSSVSIFPTINVIEKNAGGGQTFPESELYESQRGWLIFSMNEEGFTEPAQWLLEEPRGSLAYLEVGLRSLGRASTEKLGISYPFGSYRLDDFTLSEELQQQIEMQGDINQVRNTNPIRGEAFIRIYEGRYVIERVHFDVNPQDRDASSKSELQPQPQPEPEPEPQP